jgi:hypothetical protein
MKENLPYGVGDVGVGECQVLEGPGEGSELSWIYNRRPGCCRDLGLCIHGHRDQLVVHHPSALSDVESELALSEEDRQGGVRLGLNKPQSEEVRGEPVVPRPGYLLQPIERLVDWQT